MNEWNLGTARTAAGAKNDLCSSRCDKYDYLAAVGCGVLAGLVDIFLVGSPVDQIGNPESILGKWTDRQADEAVMKFAELCGWKREGSKRTIQSAIGYLEHGVGNNNPAGFQGFRVNYDQNHSGKVGGAFKMSPQNHHMMSIAHSPDLIGLFFSLLNQFTQTSSFIVDGKIVTIQTPEGPELLGKDLTSKLFCGVVNWFGHIMSDIAGSSGTRGKKDGGRGSGVVIPFYELFGLCNFGSFPVGDGPRNTLSKLARKVYENGYDARWGITMSIPVLLCDLSIKMVWAIRQYFGRHCPLEECIPTQRHSDLRVMLIMGDATLCVLDGADALARGGGNALLIFSRLNLIAWYRLVKLVLREACIRLNVRYDPGLEQTLEGYRQINAELEGYLSALKQVDEEQFRQETERYEGLAERLEMACTEEQLNAVLKSEFRRLGLALPYEGSFDDFMNDENAVLVYS